VSISETEAVFRIPAAVDVYVNDTDQGTLPVAFTMSLVGERDYSILAIYLMSIR